MVFLKVFVLRVKDVIYVTFLVGVEEIHACTAGSKIKEVCFSLHPLSTESEFLPR